MAKSVINNRPWGSFVVAETALVADFQYNNVTGFATVTAPGINAFRGDMVRMADIEFICSDEYAGVTTTFFPDNTRPEGQYFEVKSRIDADTFTVDVGISTIAHVYDEGGNVYRYRQNIRNVDYQAQTGITSITSEQHGFKQGDIVELGDIRFDCPVFTPDYLVENFQYDKATGLSTVTTTLDNNIQVGDRIKLDSLQFQCDPYGNNRTITNFVYDNTTGLSTVVTAQAHGIALNPRTPVGVATAAYDNQTGILTVTTVSNINFEDKLGEGVQLSNLEFSCDSAGLPGSLLYPEENLVYKIVGITSARTFTTNVGVSTIAHTYVGGGNATKVDRSDVKFEGIKFDCPSYGNDIDITDFIYDNITGQSLITVDRAHGLTTGDDIKLANIKFQCNAYGNDYDVLGASYDNNTGIVTVTVDKQLKSIRVGDKIRLKDTQWDCEASGPEYNIVNVFFDVGTRQVVITVPSQPIGLNPGDDIKLAEMGYFVGSGATVAYPDGRDASYNIFNVTDVQPNSIISGYWDITTRFPNVTSPFTIFNNVGKLTTGITTNIYPENVGAEGGIYDVLRIRENNQFEINVGINSIVTTYLRNGQAFTGVTTNFFPGNAQNSPKGNIYEVLDVPTNNQVRINVGVSSIPHIYDEGGSMFVGITTNIFPDGTRGNFFPVIGVAGTNVLRVDAGISSIPHNYESGGEMFVGITTNIFPGNMQNSPRGNIFEVVAKDEMCPDRFEIRVGPSSITHKYQSGGTVTTGVTTNRFPDGTFGFRFPVTNVIDEDTFLVNVGTSTITHNYVDGGFARRYEMPVTNFVYDNVTGLSTVGVSSHRLNIGDIVKLRDIKFDCDPYGNEKGITAFTYDNLTGKATVTTADNHNLLVNDVVKLSGIQMDCDAYGNSIAVTGATYNRFTGEIEVSLASAHNLSISENVKLDGLEFSCPGGSGITTTFFPDGTAPSINIYKVTGLTNATTFTCNVGVSTIAHTYVSGGNAFVGITTNIFPGNAQNSPRGSFLKVTDTPSTNTFTVNVGTSTITHNYVRGGLVQIGITTDIFPDGTQGEYFVVENVFDTDTFQINAGLSSITHRYNSGGYASKQATYQSKFPQVIDSSVIRVSGDCVAVGDRVDQLAGIVTSIIDQGPSAAPGATRVDVKQAVYNNATGDLTVTTKDATSIALSNIVDVRDLLFKCSKTTSVTAASYNNETGLTRIVTASDHFLQEGDKVLLEGLEFSCPGGSLVYPSNPGTPITVTKRISKTSYEIQLTLQQKFTHYVKGGTSSTDPTTRVFPDTKVYRYQVTGVLSDDTFVINVGTSTIEHTYVSGGSVAPGQRYDVSNATYNKSTGELRVTTAEKHFLVANTGVNLEGLQFSCNSGGPNNAPGTLTYPDGVPANVTASTYDNVTGLLSVTTNKAHQLYRDAFVKLEGLEFLCTGGSLLFPRSKQKTPCPTGRR